MNSTLESFIFDSRQASSLIELTGLYEHLFEAYGYDRLAHALISSQDPAVQDVIPLVIQNKGLDDWGNHYMESGYFDIDPLPGASAISPGVYIWDDVIEKNNLSEQQENMFEDAKNAGLHNGFTISVHGPNGSKANAVVASSEKKIEANPRTYDILNLASYQFHLCFFSLAIDASKTQLAEVILSPKEQEILKWASQGLTKYDISDRMSTSPHTVDYHMRNILKKLQAKNTCAAVVIAIKNGLILP